MLPYSGTRNAAKDSEFVLLADSGDGKAMAAGATTKSCYLPCTALFKGTLGDSLLQL